MSETNYYLLEEIKTHNTQKSIWIVIDDHVFDVTTYISKHPGGSQIFLKYAGTDCTKQFNDARHVDAYNYMDDLYIGKVKY